MLFKSDFYYVWIWLWNNKLVIRYLYMVDIVVNMYWLFYYENCLFWVVCMCVLFLVKKKWNFWFMFNCEVVNLGI